MQPIIVHGILCALSMFCVIALTVFPALLSSSMILELKILVGMTWIGAALAAAISARLFVQGLRRYIRRAP